MALRRAVSCALALCAVGSAAAFVLPVTVPARLSPAAAGGPRAPIVGVGLLGARRQARPQAQGRRQGLVGLRAEADFYADLGVSRGADEKEIKSAFRAKARKLHPDVNKAPDAQQQFQKIQLAYEVLSDPQKKSMYDRWGAMALPFLAPSLPCVRAATEPTRGDVDVLAGLGRRESRAQAAAEEARASPTLETFRHSATSSRPSSEVRAGAAAGAAVSRGPSRATISD